MAGKKPGRIIRLLAAVILGTAAAAVFALEAETGICERASAPELIGEAAAAEGSVALLRGIAAVCDTCSARGTDMPCGSYEPGKTAEDAGTGITESQIGSAAVLKSMETETAESRNGCATDRQVIISMGETAETMYISWKGGADGPRYVSVSEAGPVQDSKTVPGRTQARNESAEDIDPEESANSAGTEAGQEPGGRSGPASVEAERRKALKGRYYRYTAELRGLSPDTVYIYRIGDDLDGSLGWFKTPPGPFPDRLADADPLLNGLARVDLISNESLANEADSDESIPNGADRAEQILDESTRADPLLNGSLTNESSNDKSIPNRSARVDLISNEPAHGDSTLDKSFNDDPTTGGSTSDENGRAADKGGAAARTCDILYLGDVQCESSLADYDSWGKMVSGIAARHPNIRLAVMGGDMVNEPGEAEQWEAFLKNCRGLAHIPVAAVSGNHEGVSSNETYKKMFEAPDNGPDIDELKEGFYYIDIGACRFIMTDSSFLEDERRAALGAAEWTRRERAIEEWLKKTISESGRVWNIAVIHHPPYGMHDKDTVSPLLRELWSPILESCGVDMVLCGHQHMYMRTGKINGIVYIMGNSGQRKSGFYNGRNAPGYCADLYGDGANYQIISADPNRLRVTSYDEKGLIVDEASVTKALWLHILKLFGGY